MDKIIRGKRYNTETATEIAEYSSDYSRSDFKWYEEELYQKRTGEFFLHGHGGPMTKYAESDGDGWTYGEKIIPLTVDEAKDWVEKYSDTETYIKLFGDPDEDGFIPGKSSITLRISNQSIKRMDNMAKASGTTRSAIIEKLIKEAK